MVVVVWVYYCIPRLILKHKGNKKRERGAIEKEEVKFFRLEERSKLSGFLELDVGPA